MEEFRYSFKSSMVVVLFIFSGITAYMYINGKDWIYLFLYPVAFLVFLINQYFTRYYVKNNELIIKDLFRKKKINFNQIRRVRKEEINWFGQFFSGRPKTSVTILYNKFDEAEVFPQDTDRFLEVLNTTISKEE